MVRMTHTRHAYKDAINILLAFVIGVAIPIQGDEICYDDLGCFSDADSCHRGSTAMFPPDHPDVVGTRFLLFTPQSRLLPHPINRESSVASLEEVHLNSSSSTKVIVHGWSAGKNRMRSINSIDKRTGMFQWMLAMKDEFLDEGYYNIILVDWTGGSTNPLFYKCVQNTRVVGREIGILLEVLHYKMALDYADVHLIGVSLGAHVAGYAGEHLEGKLRRITGLDPAGPGFKDTDPLCRLDEADATYVDVIHTDINGFGINQNIGTVDFYPNGGHNQPGCSGDQLICSHIRATVYFTLSINEQCPFTSFPCVTNTGAILGICDPDDGCPTMGTYSDRLFAYGQLCVVVRSKHPYCDSLVEVISGSSPGEESEAFISGASPGEDSETVISSSSPGEESEKIKHKSGGGSNVDTLKHDEHAQTDEGSGSDDEFPDSFLRSDDDNQKYKRTAILRKIVVKLTPLKGKI